MTIVIVFFIGSAFALQLANQKCVEIQREQILRMNVKPSGSYINNITDKINISCECK